MHYPIIASLLAASTIFFGFRAQAADCSGDLGAHPYISWAWDIRQAACGDGACEAQFASEGSTGCNLTMPFGGGWAAEWVATDASGAYKSCWDASEDIINQCLTTGAYTESSHSSSGDWSLGSESYTLTIALIPEYVTFNPNDYGLQGEDSNPPPFSNPAPLVTSTTTSAAPLVIYTCSDSCRGYVPDGNWCAANCPCFKANSVC